MAGLIDLNGLGHFKDKENAMVASDYVATKTYAVGEYAYYNGTLYRCKTAITTAEAWTSGHWTTAKIGDDVTELKTATIDKTNFSSWVKGTFNANGSTANNNGAISSAEKLHTCLNVFIADGSRAVLAFYNNTTYLGKVGVNDEINKTAGDWQYFTGTLNPQKYAPENATHFLLCLLPTDSTVITDNAYATTWANNHTELNVSTAKNLESQVDNNTNSIANILNNQKTTIFDSSISFTTFQDIPVNFPAGTYDFYASAFVSSDTDESKCRMVLRSSGGSDIYTWDNNRNVEITRVITSNQDVAVLRIYAGTTYSNSLNDTLSVSSMIFRLHTPLSNRLDEIETNIQTEIGKTDPLTERTTGILERIKGKYMSHIGVSKTSNIIIPSQSLADLERTVRLGFNSIELNVRKTSDDKYVCIHGESGNFGAQFEDINGDSVSSIEVSSMTLSEIKSTIRFKSKYARYKTAPFTLQEMLYECKKLGIIPLIEYQTTYTDEISIIESIMGKSDYMLATYTNDRSAVGSNAPMFSWLSITNPTTLVAKCNASGGAYIAGLNVTADAYASFTESDWKSLVNAVHDAGYAVSCAYGSQELKQTLLKCGFDIINTSNNVNEIETGNALNIPDTVTFSGFTTTGTISGGVLSLSDGQKIAPTTTPDSVFLGAGSLHIVFDGEITVTMGEASFGTFQSDGSQDTWLSTVYEEAVPTFEITSSGNTTVKMLSFKSSEV